MKYLIKDLSRLTGIDGARIRKWQERYRLLRPERGENGYWYYGFDDFIILTNMKRRLDEGVRLSSLVEKGREPLLELQETEQFSSSDLRTIRAISLGELSSFEPELDAIHKKEGLRPLLRGRIHDILTLVGNAWQVGLINVSEEHAFSRWVFGYIQGKVQQIEVTGPPKVLVCAFPGDIHELGALMVHANFRSRGVASRFAGTMPLEHILEDLKKTDYRTVSLSMVFPRPLEKIEAVKRQILDSKLVKKVMIGGRGYHLSKMQQGSGSTGECKS